MITRICQHCGKEYETFPSIKPKYCSHRCASDAKKRGRYVSCSQCGKPFWQFRSRPDSKYCSKSCVRTAINLTDANPSYHRDISGENNPMYGVQRLGPDNPMYGKTKGRAPRWNGGRKSRPDGYIYVVVPEAHPYPAYTKPSGTKYILEHRFVMEQYLGRYLKPEEAVHHIDGDPSNNHIDNLQLFASHAEHVKIAHGSNPEAITNDPEYIAYLWSAAWKRKRAKAIKRADYKCEQCGTSSEDKTLHVHHKTYDHVYNESPEDLIVLCVNCHPSA